MMPDLTLEVAQTCAATIPYKSEWSEGGYRQHLSGIFEVECSCPGYKYRKKCKHSKLVESQRCTWHEMYSDESQEQDGICPACGGPAVPVQVGV